MKLYWQHLRCKNDANGNPRRLFVIYNADGSIHRVEDEGYRGEACIREYVNAGAEMIQLITLDITLSDRRNLLKIGRA